jgi:hypothetical protein
MWDDELLNLAADYKDLTEMAQQVLRDEMRKRNLGDPASVAGPHNRLGLSDCAQKTAANIYWDSPRGRRSPDPAFPDSKDDEPREYTWKVRLCQCEGREQASQIAETLQRNGIDCWIDAAQSKYFERFPTISVAADQLERAQGIIAQPIPQDIIDESKAESSARQFFDVPKCPYCGAPDPILAPAKELLPGDPMPDPKEWVNTWGCEVCGREWSDSGADSP